ncbi:MAG TPA: APC family permease [Thermoanaerobaculia bacterium]|nr:APC family permease [Thermoanaerobaculia bacterium]
MTLRRGLTAVEYFTFGFGTMVGVGWVVLMDDWLGRGGPGGAFLGFLLGGALLWPIARTYGRMVAEIPDAGAEIAYTEGVFAPPASFAAAWTMVLAYAIVCPWEAVAIGNLLARVVPAMNAAPLYEIAGKTLTAPRLVAGLVLTGLVAGVNLVGIRVSGLFQNALTFGLLALFAIFTAAGLWRGSTANLPPLFARPGTGGALLSILLVLQIVPYFMTGFESVGKGSEEASPGFDRRGFGRAILAAASAGTTFYCLIIAAVALVFPWRELVARKLGTEAAFAQAFSSRAAANLILVAAVLSLVKIFNGNFVASTRMLYGIGKRGLVHGALARTAENTGTPSFAIGLMAALTAATTFLGDALLVPVTEVGSLAVGVGWLATCAAFLARHRDRGAAGRGAALSGAAVAGAIVAMKALPFVPGSFSGAEWIAFALWSALGLLFWTLRPRETGAHSDVSC